MAPIRSGAGARRHDHTTGTGAVMITLHDEPPDDRPPRIRGLSRRLERAFIALALAVLLMIIILVAIGIIPLWIILGITS
jgi:hypothetical protein